MQLIEDKLIILLPFFNIGNNKLVNNNGAVIEDDSSSSSDNDAELLAVKTRQMKINKMEQLKKEKEMLQKGEI